MLKTLGTHNYYVYLLTNYNKSVLYVGVTNNLKTRLHQHKNPKTEDKVHFTSKYKLIDDFNPDWNFSNETI